MGFAIPAFAADEYGNLESGEQLLSQPQSVPEERIFLPDATNVVTNGDFETGNLNGWTTFTTANGQINESVCLFDTDGVSGATQSACFNVGEIVDPGDVIKEGGGILQSIITPAGTVMIAADIAAHDQGAGPNSSCGEFKLFFDNVEVDSHDFGSCPSNNPADVERAQLTATVNGVSAGSHEVKIQIARQFLTLGNTLTPMEYVDNVQVLVDMDEVVVGGEFLPIDHTALLLAGAQTNAVWIMSALAVIGSVAFGALYLTSRKN